MGEYMGNPFTNLKIPLICAGGAAFIILLIVIFIKLAVSRESNGVNVNVQNSNTATNDNPVIPPSAPQVVLPTTPPAQPAFNNPEMDIQEILKKKGYLRT